MAGITGIFRTDGSHLDPRLSEPIARPHRPDAEVIQAEIRVEPWCVIAAETNSLTSGSSAGGLSLVRDPRDLFLHFDGRIDNRSEILAALGNPEGLSEESRDVELFACGFQQWGNAVADRVIGPFAAVAVSLRDRWIRLFRDPLGARTVYYSEADGLLAIGSRIERLLEVWPRTLSLNEVTVARYLAIDGAQHGATFFREISEVLPGHVCTFGRQHVFSEPATSLQPMTLGRRASEADHKEEFRRLLDQAVSCRLPSDQPIAVLMSGGLDSTSIAATAASLQAGISGLSPIAVSWTYQFLPGIDESRWIDAVEASAGMRCIRLASDDLWPLSREESWPHFPDHPLLDLHWRPLDEGLRVARENGCRTILSGHFGDHHWSRGGDRWLADLLSRAKVGAAITGLFAGLSRRRGGYSAPYSLRAALGRVVRRQRHASSPHTRSWLTAHALSVIRSAPGEPERAAESEAAYRASTFLSPVALDYKNRSRREAALRDVELLHPYHDRRLVEFSLGLPGWLIYKPGETKRLLRRALADRLPPEVLHRTERTSMAALAFRGLDGPGKRSIEDMLHAPDVVWPRFVERDPLAKALDPGTRTAWDGPESVLPWYCYCLERWLKNLRITLASCASLG